MNILEYAIAKKLFGSGANSEGGSSGDDSIVGTWVFNDEIEVPTDMYLADFSAYSEWDNKTLVFDKFVGDGECMGYYYEGEGDAIYLEDVYVVGDGGWNSKDAKTVHILKAPSAEVEAWIRANAKKQESIVGTWKFNDTIDFEGIDFYFDLYFYSPDNDAYVAYNNLYSFVDNEGNSCLYVEGDFRGDTVFIDGNFTDERRKTFYIPKEIAPDAAAWVRANAKKVSGGNSGSGSNNPTAYHLTSVDDLPTDAVDGSLAVVTAENDILGTWVFDDELTPADFECNFLFRYTDNYDVIHNCIKMRGKANVDYEMKVNYEMGHLGLDCYMDGWEEDYVMKITIITEPTDNAFIAWLNKNAEHTDAIIHTLYSRENGEWVSKGEI